MQAERRTRIKFCGITSPSEAALAVDAGADAVGMILAPSPRRIGLDQARSIAAAVPAFVELFAVFVNPEESDVRRLAALGARPQFHGQEPPAFCETVAAGAYLKAYHVQADSGLDARRVETFAESFPRATLLFDSASDGQAGGTGIAFGWEPLRGLASRRRIVVSGGLTPGNVGECIRAARPYGVDVRSGIETGGEKDVEKMHAFVRAVREADAQT